MKRRLHPFLCICVLVCLCAGCSAKTDQMNADEQGGTTSNVDLNAAAEINAQLGIYYINHGSVVRAKEKLVSALNQSPQNPKVLSAMGYYSEIVGEPAKAEKYYLNSISVAPQDGVLHNNYGAFLCRSKRYKEATHQFFVAVQDPDYIASADAYENAGLCMMQVSNVKLAKAYFYKALQNDPDSAKSLWAMSKISYQEKKYAQANNYLQKLSRVARLNGEALMLGMEINEKLYNQKAVAYYRDKLKDYENAIQAQKNSNAGE